MNRHARRMLAICVPLGIHTPFLFPETAGREYEVTRYLEPLQPIRKKFSVISGLMHPMVGGGHSAEKSFLTGAPHPGHPSFANTISVDQFAAERIGHKTRFPFLALSADSRGISYTRSGVQIPTESRPLKLYERLFLEGSEDEKAAQMRRLKDGQSILDLVGNQARELQRRTGREDLPALDQYFTSVRELEKRLVLAEDWAKRPKPKVDQPPPTDIIEREEMRLLSEFLQRLDKVREADRTLLDQTAVLMGSNLGNASSHNNSNLPILAAGGRFRHAGHLAFDPNGSPPLGNLLVSFLQHLELEVDRFSTGMGTLGGLTLT